MRFGEKEENDKSEEGEDMRKSREKKKRREEKEIYKRWLEEQKDNR